MNPERNYYSIGKSRQHRPIEFSSSNVELDDVSDEESRLVTTRSIITTTTPAPTAVITHQTNHDTNSCWSRRDWIILVFGQGIALSLACCSISSAQLQNMSGIAHMPLFQVSFGYFFLHFHVYFLNRNNVKNVQHVVECMENSSKEELCSVSTKVTSLVVDDNNNEKKKHERSFSFWNVKLHSSWYYYALVAFLDVQANYFVVLSFRYTAVIHSTILTSISVISVMASSRLILDKTFQMRHFLGAILCVIGASCVISLDVSLPQSTGSFSSGSGSGGSTCIGDLFAVVAALLFGLNDCLAEYTIQHSTPDEYLAMMGVFGFLFSFCESLIFEHVPLRHFCIMVLKCTGWYHGNDDDDDDDDYHEEQQHINLFAIFTLWAWYIVTFYTFYASASRFLRIADATLLSLSLQTSNLWTMIFSVFVQDFTISPTFLCSVAMILFGVWLYEQGPSATTVGSFVACM